jgi:hypothetical protein
MGWIIEDTICSWPSIHWLENGRTHQDANNKVSAEGEPEVTTEAEKFHGGGSDGQMSQAGMGNAIWETIPDQPGASNSSILLYLFFYLFCVGYSFYPSCMSQFLILLCPILLVGHYWKFTWSTRVQGGCAAALQRTSYGRKASNNTSLTICGSPSAQLSIDQHTVPSPRLSITILVEVCTIIIHSL